MKEKLIGLYKIEDYHVEPGRGDSAYGPSIILDRRVVETLAQIPQRNSSSLPLHKVLEQYLLRSMPAPYNRSAGLEFYKDSLLLISISCYGGISRPSCHITPSMLTELEEGIFPNVRYRPFNIDQADLSSAVLSTWLMWFNHVIEFTPFELPTADSHRSD